MTHPIRLRRLVLLIGAAALAACAPSRELATDVVAELEFDPAPFVGEVRLGVKLTDAHGQPISGAELELEGNMNHAGMVPVFVDPSEVSAGAYESDFEFTMGGDWLMTIRGTLPDGRELEHTLEVPGVPSTCSTESCCANSGSLD
jgi:hypothetical protein